jgi:hypothetical protein
MEQNIMSLIPGLLIAYVGLALKDVLPDFLITARGMSVK